MSPAPLKPRIEAFHDVSLDEYSLLGWPREQPCQQAGCEGTAKQLYSTNEVVRYECDRCHVGLVVRAPSAESERDRYKRLFNRLDAAISHHEKADRFKDDHDDALYKARDRIVRDSAKGKG